MKKIVKDLGNVLIKRRILRKKIIQTKNYYIILRLNQFYNYFESEVMIYVFYLKSYKLKGRVLPST